MDKTEQENNLLANITSWNVRGLGKITKLKQVLNRIKDLKSKIIFIQESHMTATDVPRLTKRWPGQVFHASLNSQARGIAILIHKLIPFQSIKVIKDPYGRYIIVQGNILSQKINLINIYGPNDDSPSFFENLFLTISALEGLYIIGGDFNCTLDPVLDRSTQLDNTHIKTRKILHNYIHDLRLYDIWIIKNPSKREYSCYSSSYKSHSRIDYFLISEELQPQVKKCWYNSIVISDHAAMSMEIQLDKIGHCPMITD